MSLRSSVSVNRSSKKSRSSKATPACESHALALRQVLQRFHQYRVASDIRGFSPSRLRRNWVCRGAKPGACPEPVEVPALSLPKGPGVLGCPSDIIFFLFLARACPEHAEGKGIKGWSKRVFQQARWTGGFETRP